MSAPSSGNVTTTRDAARACGDTESNARTRQAWSSGERNHVRIMYAYPVEGGSSGVDRRIYTSRRCRTSRTRARRRVGGRTRLAERGSRTEGAAVIDAVRAAAGFPGWLATVARSGCRRRGHSLAIWPSPTTYPHSASQLPYRPCRRSLSSWVNFVRHTPSCPRCGEM